MLLACLDGTVPICVDFIQWLIRYSSNTAFCCSGTQSLSQCLFYCRRCLLTSCYQMALSTLALTAPTFDGLLIEAVIQVAFGVGAEGVEERERVVECCVLVFRADQV